MKNILNRVILMSHQHRKKESDIVSCAVITVSDTRNKETDKSGQQIIELLSAANHEIKVYEVITDDGALIKQTVKKVTQREDIQAIILNGGTGISYRDVTIESIAPLFDKELPGFGELFRYLSYKYDIGTASMLSRATCGIANHRVIFSLPGSTGAVTLAMKELIIPELGHIVSELNKDIKQ